MGVQEQCRTQARSLKRRVTVWTAAAATMALAIAGSAYAEPAELSPAVRAMARQLAQRDPIQSCAADSAPTSPALTMFSPGGGAVGEISGPLRVGGPGLWVQCSLPYTNG